MSMTASTIYLHDGVAFSPALLGAKPFWREQAVIVIMRPPNIVVCVIVIERVWYFAGKMIGSNRPSLRPKCMELKGGSLVHESETSE